MTKVYRIAGIFFILAAFTDYLDGKIARKNNQVTDFGKLLDPIADKILTTSAYIYFVKIDIVSIVPIIVIFTREFLVSAVRLLACQEGKVIAANFLGKFKTIFQLSSIVLAILFLYLNVNLGLKNIFTQSVFVLFRLFVWLSTILSVVSCVTYFYAWNKINNLSK